MKTRIQLALLLAVVPWLSIRAQAVERDSVKDERAYASAVSAIGDSIIHRLDFFPDRAQLRVQMAFVSSPNALVAVPFDEIAEMSAAVAVAVDEGVERFAAIVVPHDLRSLHAELMKSLRSATAAADPLTLAARACSTAPASIQRCQTPFTAASSQLSSAYKDYRAVRTKIASQVLDTQTHLSEFKPTHR